MKRRQQPPPMEGLRRQIVRSRSGAVGGHARSAFIRETFILPRQAAREKAREWLDTWPKAAYWTEIETWRCLSDDRIEFTMRRLPTAD